MCSETVESKHDKLGRDQPYSDTYPNGDCSLPDCIKSKPYVLS